MDHLAININYRHLYVNDKKHLDVIGYDDEGNIFNGLDGFRFDWEILDGKSNAKLIQRPDGYVNKRIDESTDD